MEVGKSYRVKIFDKTGKKYDDVMSFQNTFGEVPIGANLLYLNSLLQLAIGMNQGNFAQKMNVQSGLGWRIEIESANAS